MFDLKRSKATEESHDGRAGELFGVLHIVLYGREYAMPSERKHERSQRQQQRAHFEVVDLRYGRTRRIVLNGPDQNERDGNAGSHHCYDDGAPKNY